MLWHMAPFAIKVSSLVRSGVLEQEYNAGAAFYTLKGVHFGKKRKKTMTPTMTRTHMGVSPVTGVTIEDNDITNLPIYKEIQKLPPEQKALHDIHLKFQVPDIWDILARSKRYNPNPVSKDISLPFIITSNHLKIHTIVHRTDTATVSIACSFAPIATDTEGLIRLSNALTRVEERISRIVDECGNMLPGGYESVPIPEHEKWTVTLWHFGIDSQNYKEDNSCITWQQGQNVLSRNYNKNARRGKIKRCEIQECPQKRYADAIKAKMSQEG
jgi:hypothetical protein